MVAAATGNDNKVSKMFKTKRNLNSLKGSRILENKIRHVSSSSDDVHNLYLT